jgi:hypothetical protein
MKKCIVLGYRADYEQAFDAIKKALENWQYVITDVFEGRREIQFHPPLISILPVRALDPKRDPPRSTGKWGH